MYTIYHNPRCSKSRQTLKILEGSKQEFEIKDYLKNAPTKDELEDLLDILEMRPIDLCRRGESVFKELGLNDQTPDEKVLEAMCAHPILIERPIVVYNNRAVIGRPPEKVLELINS